MDRGSNRLRKVVFESAHYIKNPPHYNAADFFHMPPYII